VIIHHSNTDCLGGSVCGVRVKKRHLTKFDEKD
jgi:hypothetical protein